jgi:hypothetical protein
MTPVRGPSNRLNRHVYKTTCYLAALPVKPGAEPSIASISGVAEYAGAFVEAAQSFCSAPALLEQRPYRAHPLHGFELNTGLGRDGTLVPENTIGSN